MSMLADRWSPVQVFYALHGCVLRSRRPRIGGLAPPRGPPQRPRKRQKRFAYRPVTLLYSEVRGSYTAGRARAARSSEGPVGPWPWRIRAGAGYSGGPAGSDGPSRASGVHRRPPRQIQNRRSVRRRQIASCVRLRPSGPIRCRPHSEREARPRRRPRRTATRASAGAAATSGRKRGSRSPAR